MPVTSLPQNGGVSVTPPSSARSRGSSAFDLDTMTNRRPSTGVERTLESKEMLNCSVPVGSAAAGCVECPSDGDAERGDGQHGSDAQSSQEYTPSHGIPLVRSWGRRAPAHGCP